MQGETQKQRTARGLSHRSGMGLFESAPPPVALGLLSCAVVATAHLLGTGWISESVAGLPLGMWIVGGVVGGALWRSRHARVGEEQRREAPEEAPPVTKEPADSIEGPSVAEFAEKAREAVARLFSHPIYGAEEDGAEGSVRERAPALRIGRGEHALRIGVGGPEEIVEAFVEQVKEEGQTIAKYEPVATPVREPEDCAKRSLSGAVTFSSTGQTAIVLPEARGREAAWEDWSQRLALSYPAVFPPRIDGARIACGPVRLAAAREARLVARLAEAAAVLAQSEARTGNRRSPDWMNEHRRRCEHAMTLLARTFASDWSPEDARRAAPPATCRAAARGLGAWLTTWDGAIDAQERRQWVGLCTAFLSEEPESHLRLAAAQIGAYEDDEAIPAMRRAFEILRESGEMPVTDPLAFVMAEVELGSYGSLALGRVAAGLTMAWATTPKESIAYLRDDLVDDLRHAGKLVGRDQDHAFLKRVMAYLDRLRSDTLPLKTAA